MNNKISFRDRVLEHTILRLVPNSVTPNQITWIRIVLSPFVLYLMIVKAYFLGLIIFSVAALTDAMDGSMARTRDQVTNLGKFLDALGDRLLIGVVALVIIPRFLGWELAWSIIGLEIIQTIAAAIIQYRAGLQIEANWAGKVKMVLQSISIVFLFLFILLDVPIYQEIAKYGLWLSLIPLALQPFMYGGQLKKIPPQEGSI